MSKVVAEQLLEYLDTEDLLHPMQFGFRKSHSTETAFRCLLEVVKDKGGVVGASFLDLEAILISLQKANNIFDWKQHHHCIYCLDIIC